MNNCSKPSSLLLDSRLIITTLNKIYNVKLVQCGDYCQLYFYNKKQLKKEKKDISDLQLKKIQFNKILQDINTNNKKETILTDSIRPENITRSKLECQRLAKANMNDWKIFVTLTFAENMTDINIANKRFRYFIDKVQRVKKDFKYLCITEFQKRGAIHYHLLCNIDITDKTLLYEQADNKKFLHIKYWNDGFTSIEPMANDCKKVVGYISKYMTKDIDNRLFSHRRYFYSRNLTKPSESYINLDIPREAEYLKKIIQRKDLIYQSDYINPFDNCEVSFFELIEPTNKV